MTSGLTWEIVALLITAIGGFIAILHSIFSDSKKPPSSTTPDKISVLQQTLEKEDLIILERMTNIKNDLDGLKNDIDLQDRRNQELFDKMEKNISKLYDMLFDIIRNK